MIKDKQKILEYSRKQSKKWRAENREYDLARRKKYRHKDAEYREKNRERLRLESREHYSKNKDILNTKYRLESETGMNRTMKASLKNKYNLSVEVYNQMFIDQNNKCKICQIDFSMIKKRAIHIDHDHKTGKVRGLLCNYCNVGLGYFRDNPKFLEDSIHYLKLNGISNLLKLKVKKLHPNAIAPTKAHNGDAGYDLYDPGNNSVSVKLFENECVMTVALGIAIEIPNGFYGQIQGRSSLASMGIFPIGGVIDSSYRGEVKVMLHVPIEMNTTVQIGTTHKASWFPESGNKIAQLVLLPVPECEIEFVDELDMNTDRSINGFGSTGA